MKKFVFPLNTVLKFKERMAEHEKNLLNRLRLQMQIIAGELTALQEKYHLSKMSYAEKSAAGISVPELILCHAYLKELETEIDAKTILHQEAELAVDKQMKILIAISQEQKSMEILKDKQFGRYQAQLMKEEEIFIEEFVTNGQISAEGNGLSTGLK